MTTIIARHSGDIIELAFDSLATDTDKGRAWEMRQHKVGPVGGIILGVSGSVRALNIAFAVERYGSTIEGVVETFRKALQDGGCVSTSDGTDTWDGDAIVILGGRIYEVDDSFSYMEDFSGVAAVGSGSKFALGALQAGATTKRALEVAAELDPYTGGPLYVTDSERIKGRWSVYPVKEAA